jgi:RNA polymerase sigma factor (sigma-70 family)
MIPTFMSVISPAIRAMSDAELVAAMREGKGEALTALFARYARLVHRVAAQILRDHGEAEDSTQEIFFEIYRKAHLYDAERGPVRGWLLQYAYRRTLRRRSMLTRRAAYAGEPIENLDDIAQRPPSLSTEECRWVLRSALRRPDLARRRRTARRLGGLHAALLLSRPRTAPGMGRRHDASPSARMSNAFTRR